MTSRALIVTPYASTGGGAEQWLLGILADGALQAAGWELDAIVLQAGPLRDALRGLGVTTITYPVPADPARIVTGIPGLHRAISARAPDVIIANGVKAQLAVALAFPGRRPPCVWVKHDHSYDRTLARLLGRHAREVVSTAAEVGAATGRADVVIIEPPRPPDPVPRAQAREAFAQKGWAPTTRLTLGLISRLVPYKGIDLAIEALTHPGCAEWSVLAIGDDDPATPGEADRLRALAVSLGVSDRVRLTGGIAGAGQLLTGVDAAGVLTRPGERGAPSKEGYGIVATEAMLAGIPVIVAQPGPIAKRLDTPSGPAGIVLTAPSAPAVAGALQALDDDTVREQMGARGAKLARTLPDQHDVAVRFAGVLQSFRGDW